MRSEEWRLHTFLQLYYFFFINCNYTIFYKLQVYIYNVRAYIIYIVLPQKSTILQLQNQNLSCTPQSKQWRERDLNPHALQQRIFRVSPWTMSLPYFSTQAAGIQSLHVLFSSAFLYFADLASFYIAVSLLCTQINVSTSIMISKCMTIRAQYLKVGNSQVIFYTIYMV